MAQLSGNSIVQLRHVNATPAITMTAVINYVLNASIVVPPAPTIQLVFPVRQIVSSTVRPASATAFLLSIKIA